MKREDFGLVYWVACFCGIPDTIVDEIVEAFLQGDDLPRVLMQIRDRLNPPPTWKSKGGSA